MFINHFKMKKKIIVSLFLLVSIVIQAQDKVMDSLQNSLKNTKNDIDRTKLLNAISDRFKYSDPEEMVNYANKAIQLAQKIKFRTKKVTHY